ncbi:hypothetical protein [Clostridium botulinum]|uniref:hypothetical protein n=1 Tax=Clostridium botulinum TaxID=1491 RepID=UPI0007740C96|nr:hypothetical protein [Clostridium botulinum]MBY6931012.1 hypothetical protein [Clostridium botulinum]NFG19918.1 hypothetical protein [Clostridium botulinum]NFO82220.1 hypothetical protein [Clostridium botulinum]
MKIKGWLKKDANSYIVMPRIHKFLRDNKLGSINFRTEGIQLIENFSENSLESKEKVNIWLDECVKEGIKYLYVTKFYFNKNINLYKSELFWKEFLDKYNLKKNIHVNEYIENNTLNYKSIKLVYDNGLISHINIIMALNCLDANSSYEHPIKENYPIFVDLDIDKEIIIVRLKSKSKIYEIKVDEDEQDCIDLNKKISCDKIVNRVINKMCEDIDLTKMEQGQFCNEMQCAYFKVLDEITKTPKEIKDKIDKFKEDNTNYIENMISKTQISPSKYSQIIEKDLNILLEKFISISYTDKSIFKTKYAFPIKLIATDSEDTKVEETASDYQPLQTKAAFYDHKKIINEEQKCEGMTLAAYRKDTTYYGKRPFTVKCDLLELKGLARIRFMEYVEEEDIQNVLSRIISFL